MTLGWPPELPQNFLQGSLTSEFNDNAIRTSMETGPAKIRLRDSVLFQSHSGSISCSLAQALVFENFYNVDHAQGAIPFEWTDPYTGAAKMWRIVAKPQKTNTASKRCRFAFQIEEVPS